MSNISTAADLLKQGAGVYAHVYHTDAETFTVEAEQLREKAHLSLSILVPPPPQLSL